jgi:adenine phosphoribosyltransferase
MFRDITTLLKDPAGFRLAIGELAGRYRGRAIDKVAGVESRGFIVGAPLAHQLGAGFIPLCKRGKLPAETVGHDYALEYGVDRIEMHVDAISAGEQVLLVDDLIATGNTAQTALPLIEMRGHVVERRFVIELPNLGGRERLERIGHPVFALVDFEGD